MPKIYPTPPESAPPVGRGGKSEALGQSEAFLEFQERLSLVARVDRPVLLIGERGTGKELAAARLHYLSKRWQGPLLALNCAALAPTLIESELFGYEAGAFTGAMRRRQGRFEMAEGGTLFLDEIANIPTEVQEKILRAVEYGTFERVGGSRPLQVNVRVIGATNKDLPDMVRTGRFSQDLLDRLSFEVLFLPPLRERAGDIPLLANHFAARMALELGRRQTPEFTEEAMAALERHAWPGNVRELKNVVERAVYRAEGPRIDRILFDPFESAYGVRTATDEQDQPAETAEPPLPLKPLEEAVKTLKLGLMRRALEEARYNQRRAARLLGLTYHQFRGLYRKYGEEIASSTPEKPRV